MSEWYRYNDGNPVPCEAPSPDVGHSIIKTRVGNATVSTIFLGLNHAFSDDYGSILFETMVFGGPLDQKQERYVSESEARSGHERMVGRVFMAEPPA